MFKVVWALHQTIPTFYDLEKEAPENIEGKGDNAGYTVVSFSHNVFYLSCKKFQVFYHIYLIICKNFNCQQSNICCLVNSLPHNPDF